MSASRGLYISSEAPEYLLVLLFLMNATLLKVYINAV